MRRVRRKGGNKDKVFGCDLLEHLNASSQDIPQVLRCCSEFVETHGIVDGIYRLSGVSSNIQKLRGEFEGDGSPDLNKDVYLQDIHCVSSLCKAYFRELPNPLLTYQLYDKFAEAVAIQLEDERLVKIRDVLKELPGPHYRTLEFLMLHLVRMASYSSETNMHARNLAIVWAPNLLRSKDIEVSGFNGTAVFKEVRVQSIVVEFILTHVPQLFPEQGVSQERGEFLLPPSAASIQDEGLPKSGPPQPVPSFGNISPGDGPLPIRPYHAIIEGTDKRKGSLKGRKWMSIFNIGGRFPDPRRRHKPSAKEKERAGLRPARSMDSLSTPPYPTEGSRRTGQRPPSTNPSTPSPLVTPSSLPGSDTTIFTGAIGGSEYAVTYRRGTGLVSGGAGTQGTYTALDPEGLGFTDNETLQTRSPGHSTKVGRRAAMHITGPTLVTVPLHITSNLAYGVLQGGGGDRVIHRGKDKDEGDRVEGKEGGAKVERRGSRERKVEVGSKVEQEQSKEMDREGSVGAEENTVAGGGKGEDGEGKTEEENEEWKEKERKPELTMGGRSVSRELRAKASNTEEDNDEDAVIVDKDVEESDEYMDMATVNPADFQPGATKHGDDHVMEMTASHTSDILNSTEVEGDELGLSGYVQDNFEFLDEMDCSILDHMDCSVPYQVNEFSVEPPGHSDDEYEVMEQAQPSHRPEAQRQTELRPHRPLSADTNNRHTKSLSLPYMTSPVFGPEESCSEEEAVGDNSDDDSDGNDYSSEDEENMFVKSLPPDFFLNNLPGVEPDIETQESCAPDRLPVHQLQISEELNLDFPVCKESTAGDQQQIEVKDKEEEEALQEKVLTRTEEEDKVHQGRDWLENDRQSKSTGCSAVEDSQSDQPLTTEASTHCCAGYPLPSNDESSTMADIVVEEEERGETTDAPFEESRDFSVSATEQPINCAGGETKERDSDEEDRNVSKEVEDMCQDMVLEIKENVDIMWEEASEDGNPVKVDIKCEEKMQEGNKEQDIVVCGTSSEIWDELEEIICEVIEEEESMQIEKKDAGRSVAEVREREEQMAKVSAEKTVHVDEREANETEVQMEVVEEPTETTEGKLTETETQQELEKKEINSTKTEEIDEETVGKHASYDETQHYSRGDVVSTERNNDNTGRADEPQRKLPCINLAESEMKKLKEGSKCEESDSSPGGVGRKLVISKHPKVYQAKAVPIVPPKPQHCRITALTLRQQQQQRERRDADRGRENPLMLPTEQDTVCGGEQEKDGGEGVGNKEKPTLRMDDKEAEKRRDGNENAMRDTSRNSPLSMCFDEAVAIATMRREKEKVCEKERQREWGNEVQ